MNEKNKNLAIIIVTAIIVFGMSIWCFLKPETDVSETERRQLKKLPEVSVDSLLGLNGKTTFMDQFEKYAADQFPLREAFRTINSVTSLYVLGKSEINNLYLSNGYIAKLDQEIDAESVEWSINRINYICDKYVTDNNVYLAIIPDKNYYLTEASGYHYLNYEEFVDIFKTRASCKYIELKDQLSLTNYYYTDTHWKQETLTKVAKYLIESMGYDYNFEFTENETDGEFKGVYYGQLAVPVKTDEIKYLTGSFIDSLVVNCFDTGKAEQMGVYNYEKLTAMDKYEFYLSGSKALITIENPFATTDKELVVFRDSFSSSFGPLLAGTYSKVTLVDIRYINPGMVGRFVDFSGSDVLFLFSAQVLNSSVGQFIN